MTKTFYSKALFLLVSFVLITSNLNGLLYINTVNASQSFFNYQVTDNVTSESNIDSDYYNGHTYVTYERDGNIYVKIDLEEEELVKAGSNPSISVSNDGTIHLVYTNGVYVYYNKKTTDWNNQYLIASGNSPDIDIDNNGKAHLIFKTNAADHDIYYLNNINGNRASENIFDFDTGITTSIGVPSIKVDGSGTPNIVSDYLDIQSNQHQIFYYSPSNSYTANYTTTPFSGLQKNSLALDLMNKPYLVYKRSDGNTYIASLNNWSRTNLGAIDNPSISFQIIGGIGLTYTEGGIIKYKSSTNGVTFGPDTTIGAGLLPCISLGDGNVNIYYTKSDGNDDEIFLTSTLTLTAVTAQGNISTMSGSFVYLTGSIGLTGLNIGGTYELMNGSTVMSNGTLTATGTSGTLRLNPANFPRFGKYNLTLSGTKSSSQITNLDSKTFYVGPINYQTLYPNVGTTLISQGIKNNLTGITNNNVTGYNGLYFQAMSGSQPLGKITFNKTLDLTNSGTIAILQNLGASLNMANGYINFTPGNNPILNTGATLEMYFTGNNNPGNISDNSLNYITARDGSNNVIQDALSGSNLLCAVGVGIPYQICTFANNHFTTFDFNPFLTSVNIRSNNILSGGLAKPGNIITLSFTGSEDLKDVSASFNGTSAAVVTGSGNYWTAISQPITTGATNGSNVSFAINFKDLNNNTGHVVTGTTNSSIVKIDTQKPTASVSYAPPTSTNQNVLATLTGASETITGTLSYTFTNNGSYTFNFQDLAGNTGSTVANVNWIDRDGPTISFAYSTTGVTNQNVIITGTTSKTIGSIINAGGFTQVNGTTLRKTLTANGSGTITFLDAAGNTGYGTYSVSNIDKVAPTISFSYSTIFFTNQNVIVTGTVSEDIGSVTNSGGFSQINSRKLLKTFTSNGSGSVIFQDPAGNIGSGSYNVTFIDKTAPTASIVYSPSSTTNQNVIATLTGFSEPVINNYSHTFTGNGSYTFIFQDLVGNTGSATANVNWIDKTPPSITSKRTSNLTTNGVTINFNFSETNYSNLTGNVIVYTGGNSSNLVETGTTRLSLVGGNLSGNSVFTHLRSGTDYTYKIKLIDNPGNIKYATGTFSTPVIVPLTGGTANEQGATGLTGNLILSGTLFNLSGTNIIINSNSGDDNFITGTLTVSGTNIFVYSGNWNGILLPPSLINSGSNQAATGSEIGTGVRVIQTVQAGGDGVELMSNGGYFTVSFKIPGFAAGTVFYIYRSNDGANWSVVNPDRTCTLDANAMCTFRTDHLTLFAPVFDSTPDTYSFTAQTGKELSTQYESNTITVAGINTGSTITIAGGEYKIGNGSYTSNAGSVVNGNTVTIRLTSSNSYLTPTSATLNIGGVNGTFSVTTKTNTTSGGGNSSVGRGGGSAYYPYYTSQTTKTSTNIDKDKQLISTESIKTTDLKEETNNIKEQTNKYIISNSGLSNTDTTNIVKFVNKLLEEIKTFEKTKSENDKQTYLNDLNKFNVLISKIKSDINNTGTSNLTTGNKFTENIDIVVKYLFDNGLTKYDNSKDFRLLDNLTRQEAAKMLVQFATKLGKVEVNTGDIEYLDSNDMDITLKDFIYKAYKLGIMKGGKGEFRPLDKMTKGEFIVVMIRILVGMKDENRHIWYENYFNEAYERGITADTIENMEQDITRNDAAVLLYRVLTQ